MTVVVRRGSGGQLERPSLSGRPHVETFRASTVDIRSRTSQLRQVDGDVIAAGDRLNVTVRPQALWVCVP
jgi:diacylglycerol kinase family enzyme